MTAAIPYIIAAVALLATVGALYFRHRAAKLGLDEAEEYIREQTALYRHYCISEVQRAVVGKIGVKLTDAQAIAIVQKIRDEYHMGPIKPYNLPGFVEPTGLQLIDESEG
jgi:hypothetical protein